MANIYLVDKNNKAPSVAQLGDIIVTGGGIFEKTASGSLRREDLEKQTGYSGGVGSYTTLANTVYDTVRTAIERNGGSSGGSSGRSSDRTQTPPPVEIDATEDNGVVFLDDFSNFGAGGYDPNRFATNTSGTGAGIKTALGYVAVGLVGLVILDRLVSGGGK